MKKSAVMTVTKAVSNVPVTKNTQHKQPKTQKQPKTHKQPKTPTQHSSTINQIVVATLKGGSSEERTKASRLMHTMKQIKNGQK